MPERSTGERVDVLERALAVAGTDDSPERARLLATLALELSQGGDWERRLALADEAVACARRLGDEVTLLRVLLHTTEATRLPATLDQRLIDTEELFDIAKRLGDPVLLGVAAVREVRVKIEAAAFDQVDEALGGARRGGPPRSVRAARTDRACSPSSRTCRGDFPRRSPSRRRHAW